MRALVVYESMFGNTQTIARAIADGLATRMAVDVVEIGAAPAAVPGDVDLLVVGGPTHAFGMSRPNTRQSAVQQATSGLVSKGQGMREWLTALPGGAPRAAAAAFDTRVKIPLIPGAARRGAENSCAGRASPFSPARRASTSPAPPAPCWRGDGAGPFLGCGAGHGTGDRHAPVRVGTRPALCLRAPDKAGPVRRTCNDCLPHAPTGAVRRRLLKAPRYSP
nr:hypothetical protein GCM10020093_019450 [Planobispora longispora]